MVYTMEAKSEASTWLIHYAKKEADGTLVNAFGQASILPPDWEESMYFIARRCKVEANKLTLMGWPQIMKGRNLTAAKDATTGMNIRLNGTFETFGGRSSTFIVQ
jgi:hypothetical protein